MMSYFHHAVLIFATLPALVKAAGGRCPQEQLVITALEGNVVLESKRSFFWGKERLQANASDPAAGEVALSEIQYLPGGPGCCRRTCGGVRGGGGLGSHGLCCCLKNGLSKRPGRQSRTHRQPREHTESDKHKGRAGKGQTKGREERQKVRGR